MQLVYLRTIPYIRLDATETTLHVWQAHCQKCGAPYEVKTPGNKPPDDGASWDVNKNCPLHKGWKSPEGRARSRIAARSNARLSALRAALRKLSDADIAAIQARAMAGEKPKQVHAHYPHVKVRTIGAIMRGEHRPPPQEAEASHPLI